MPWEFEFPEMNHQAVFAKFVFPCVEGFPHRFKITPFFQKFPHLLLRKSLAGIDGNRRGKYPGRNGPPARFETPLDLLVEIIKIVHG